MNIKEKLKDNFAVPFKKSTGKWGIKGSTLLDKKTEENCYESYYKYLQEHNLI